MANVKCSISFDPKGLSEGRILVSFKITNTSLKILKILKWNTPLEGLLSDCINIVVDQKEIEYDGKMVKRGEPQGEDFITLKPNESKESTIDLTEGYHIPENTEVKAEFKKDNLLLLENDLVGFKKEFLVEKRISAPTIISESTTFKIPVLPGKKKTLGESYRIQEKKKINESFKKGEGIPLPVFEGGDSNQRQAVLEAHNNGYSLVIRAITNLNNAANMRFKEWFDSSNTNAKRAKVIESYTKVKEKMEDTIFTYNLSGAGCGSGVFAYTYKNTTKVWLCSAFWNAPSVGTDSKAGTIVHEHTHATASTDDHTYGQENCRKLAISNPAKAITNADNFEYYAEG